MTDAEKIIYPPKTKNIFISPWVWPKMLGVISCASVLSLIGIGLAAENRIRHLVSRFSSMTMHFDDVIMEINDYWKNKLLEDIENDVPVEDQNEFTLIDAGYLALGLNPKYPFDPDTPAEVIDLVRDMKQSLIRAGVCGIDAQARRIKVKTVFIQEWVQYVHGVDIFKKSHSKIKELAESERQTLLKLVYGMARDAYGYKPETTRNTATGENKGSIKAALDNFGLTIDNGTVKKYLDEAKEIFYEKDQ